MSELDIGMMAAAGAVGALVGAVYFSGLWFTVSRLGTVRRPGIWMAVSFVLRTGIALAGFYGVLAVGEWTALLAAVAGFALARLVLVRYIEKHPSVGSTNGGRRG